MIGNKNSKSPLVCPAGSGGLPRQSGGRQRWQVQWLPIRSACHYVAAPQCGRATIWEEKCKPFCMSIGQAEWQGTAPQGRCARQLSWLDGPRQYVAAPLREQGY